MPESEWLPKVRQYAVEAMLVLILKDLAALGISFDVFFSEKALVERISKFQRANEPPIFYCGLDSFDLMHGPVGGVRHYFAEIDIEQAKLEDKAPISKVFKAPLVEGTLGEGDLIAKTIADLRARNLVYEGVLPPPKGQIDADWEEREQTLFRATAYGDDTDRPLLKSDGSYTYFAADMAYHKSKFDRGFKQMIDVWGADHGGYVTRMQAAVKALTQGEGQLDVKLCQLVRLMRNGEPVKMSKRAGDFVTLREVIDEVGRDAVRFMMLFRKNDATLDFDLVKVREQSKENPVFYVQYAYARCCSIFRQAEEQGVFPSNQPDGDLEIYFPFLENDDSSPAAYTHEADKQLILLLAQFPRLIESAAEAHEPHRIAFYLYDLASAFHAHWNKGKDETSLRFVHPDNHNLTLHRLALVESVRTVLQTGLSLLGVSSPEEMR
jgi:arginyl-tRNA synthetase